MCRRFVIAQDWRAQCHIKLEIVRLPVQPSSAPEGKTWLYRLSGPALTVNPAVELRPQLQTSSHIDWKPQLRAVTPRRSLKATLWGVQNHHLSDEVGRGIMIQLVLCSGTHLPWDTGGD
jgi:hypothetical protein